MVVVCLDQGDSGKTETITELLQKKRCAFYWLQVISEYELSQSKGIICLFVMNDPTQTQDNHAAFTRMAAQLVPFPICHVEAHLFERSLGAYKNNWLLQSRPVSLCFGASFSKTRN